MQSGKQGEATAGAQSSRKERRPTPVKVASSIHERTIVSQDKNCATEVRFNVSIYRSDRRQRKTVRPLKGLQVASRYVGRRGRAFSVRSLLHRETKK
jgi:hypothetical protein